MGPEPNKNGTDFIDLVFAGITALNAARLLCSSGYIHRDMVAFMFTFPMFYQYPRTKLGTGCAYCCKKNLRTRKFVSIIIHEYLALLWLYLRVLLLALARRGHE